jgi:hypothetical protein
VPRAVRRTCALVAIFATAVVAVLVGSTTPSRAGSLGPPVVCVPAAVNAKIHHAYPGAPKLPNCKQVKPKPKPKPAVTQLQLKLSGGFTVVESGGQGSRSSCGTQSGGWSTSTGKTVVNFGVDEATSVRPVLTKSGQIGHFKAEPIIQVTYNPSGESEHGFPPACTSVPDTASCSQTQSGDTATISVVLDQRTPDLITIGVSPSGALQPQCPAPFFSGEPALNQQGYTLFKHELDDIDQGAFVRILGPPTKNNRNKSRHYTVDWTEPNAPCSKYGGVTTPFVQGGVHLDSCTVEADFRLEITRLD